jgi:hypothetical protein
MAIRRTSSLFVLLQRESADEAKALIEYCVGFRLVARPADSQVVCVCADAQATHLPSFRALLTHEHDYLLDRSKWDAPMEQEDPPFPEVVNLLQVGAARGYGDCAVIVAPGDQGELPPTTKLLRAIDAVSSDSHLLALSAPVSPRYLPTWEVLSMATLKEAGVLVTAADAWAVSSRKNWRGRIIYHRADSTFGSEGYDISWLLASIAYDFQRNSSSYLKLRLQHFK